MTTSGRRASRMLRGPLRPLRVTQYRWLGGSVALELAAAGIWLVALVWQIIALGGGAAQVSYVATASAAGVVVTALLGGVVADRVPQRRILLAVAAVRTAAIAAVAALALSGALAVWHLVGVALLVGLATGFTYPAYSALLPAIVPTDDLIAANGLEGMLRPTLGQAAGPAVASALIAVWSPGAAIAVVAVLELAGLLCLLGLRPTPLRRELGAGPHSLAAAGRDLRDGFGYMVRTPWLLATLLYASLMVLVVMGPLEVLLPFVIKDRAGGGPDDHALALAAFGIGGAVGSLVMGARRMPRRYLTAMNLTWGVACLPLVVVGFTRHIVLIAVALFLVGVCFSAPMVIWGTLLQRRVPPELLGRVASLDFFVSLVFMPVSMALAAPVSRLVGLEATFVVAGVLPVLFGAAAVVLARLPQDELAHPLTDAPAAEPAEPAEPTPMPTPMPTPAVRPSPPGLG